MPDSDIRIMERIRDDDREAFVELVKRYQHELVGFFFHLCWDQLQAEEMAQDVFVNLYHARHRYQATAKLRTYVYRIAHNRWIDQLRRQRTHAHISLNAEVGTSALRLMDVIKAQPESAADGAGRDHQLRGRIQQAVDNLPEGQREVFVLAYNQNMKYQDIGSVLGIPEGTVKSRMHNAVRFLRDELQDLLES
jgi:RNA polymerase sigma-70 factor, ECF subfamily